MQVQGDTDEVGARRRCRWCSVRRGFRSWPARSIRSFVRAMPGSCLDCWGPVVKAHLEEPSMRPSVMEVECGEVGMENWAKVSVSKSM